MDFSLMQTESRHRGLRDILALKQRWPYYAIMVVDPILRFSWIFYAIFTHNTQHSTTVSFMVSLMEVVRRGMWSLFRVENEHCANVSQYKASRDVPLPYRIEPLMDRASVDDGADVDVPEGQEASGGDVEQSTGSSIAVGATTSSTIRRRWDNHVSQIGKSFSKMLAEAHKQDFEKKRKPAAQAAQDTEDAEGQSDDEEDEDEYEVNEASHLRHQGDGSS